MICHYHRLGRAMPVHGVRPQPDRVRSVVHNARDDSPHRDPAVDSDRRDGRAARAEVTHADISKRADIGQSGYEKGGWYHPLQRRPEASAPMPSWSTSTRRPRNGGRTRWSFRPTGTSIRPKDQTRGNGGVLVEVSNRGGRAIRTRSTAAAPRPTQKAMPISATSFDAVWLHHRVGRLGVRHRRGSRSYADHGPGRH